MSKQAITAPADLLLLKGGHVFDSASGLDKTADIMVEDGVIKKIGAIDASGFKGTVIDCQNQVIVPGLIDMHVHLREPGQEDKETILTGTNAAMAGGFTGVCSMPNTQPAIDGRNHIEFIKRRSQGLLVDVMPIGAVTKGREGKELTEMGDMVEAGASGFSDDGSPVESAAVMRKAMEYAQMLNKPLIEHCEEMSLSAGGMMNESLNSTLAGLRSIPAISEDIPVARNILISEYTGAPVHLAHISTRGAVRLIREAKARGVKVTAETCPHYFTLTDEAVRSYDTNTKMKPPLREEADRLAIIEGLKDGTIDVIATDHAPHTSDDKDCEYDNAAFGIVGLETAMGLVVTQLMQKNDFSLADVVTLMAVNPRKILRLPECAIKAGEKANLSILNLDAQWTVDKGQFYSLSSNSPFLGMELKGKATAVVNNGLYFLNK